MIQPKELANDPSNNRSLVRALHILSCFQFDKPELGLTELTIMSGLPKATVYRLASTLVYSGFLKCDEQSKRYSLGIKLFELGSIVFASFSLRKVASSHLTRLHVKTGKTVYLGALLDDELVYLDKRENVTSSLIRLSSEIGRHCAPHFGMMGQVLMAFLPESEVDRLLEKRPLEALTDKSITDREAFRTRLRVIREQGYVVQEGEVLDLLSGIAAPIGGFTDGVVGALAVGFISASVNYQEMKVLVEETVKAASAISRDLGYVNGGGSATALFRLPQEPTR